MKKWLGYPSVQITLCLALFGVVTWKFGPFGTVLVAPLLAAAIARPLLNMMENTRDNIRAAVWLPVHGEHFVFKDVTIRVLQDADHWRWVSLADARKVAGITTSEGSLRAAFGERLQKMGKPRETYIRDDALVEYLSKSTDAVALRFRTYVDRTVSMPGRTLRERAGKKPVDDDDDD
ncbi:MAG: hypothetical protein HY854_11375 [Burkholderiales bacterium]|nr:hypothetical protein [Burkholderiales bacterium]